MEIEPRTSGVGIKRSTTEAATAALQLSGFVTIQEIREFLDQVPPEDCGFVDLRALVIEGDGPSSCIDKDKDNNHPNASFRSRYYWSLLIFK